MKTEPIFGYGKIPYLPHMFIQAREWREDKWWYFLQNNYNPWGSGWGDEDFIISQIKEHGEQ